MTFEQFRDELHRAIGHLFDPRYDVPERVQRVLCCGLGNSGSAQARLDQCLRDWIEAAGGGRHGRMTEYARVLHLRYLDMLSQEAAAEQMHTSLRSLQRLQREALHAFAIDLWHRHGVEANASVRDAASGEGEGATWQTQLQDELLRLQQQAPNAQADLPAAVRGALRILQARGDPEPSIDVPKEIPHWQVRVHPSVLQQLLLSALTELAAVRERARGLNGPPKLSVQFDRGRTHVIVALSIRPTGADPSALNTDLLEGLLEPSHSVLYIEQSDDALVLRIRMPVGHQERDTVDVLVIEDNADLVSLYQSYCVATPYKLQHLQAPQEAVQAAALQQPDVILLDMMLPEVNGWDLLLDLHTHDATRHIPVVVCSVITDEQLALDLGASAYLRKPVWRAQLLDALHEALQTPYGRARHPA